MKSKKLINYLIAAVLIIGSTSFALAEWRHEGDYSIVDDIANSGSDIEQINGSYVQDSNCSVFVSSAGSVDGSSTTWAGCLPNINNIPFATLQTPIHQYTTDYHYPVFTWQYNDADSNPQAAFDLEVSTDPNFGVIRYQTGPIYSTAVSTQMGTQQIVEGRYYWRVKVMDEEWNEWSIINEYYELAIDTSRPSMPVIVATPTVHSAWAFVKSADTSEMEYRVRYSTSTSFEDHITTYTAWIDYAPGTSTVVVDLTASTTYHLQAQTRDLLSEIGVSDHESAWTTPYISTCTITKEPELYIVYTSTARISFFINRNGNPKGCEYAVRVEDYDGNIQYAEAYSNKLTDSISWGNEGTFGTTQDGDNEGSLYDLYFPDERANLYKRFSIAARFGGVDYSYFLSSTHTYTAAEEPVLADPVLNVSSTTITFGVDTVGNSSHTAYGIKLVLENGDTQYIKADGTFTDTMVFQTTTTWGNPLTIGSVTANMGYRIGIMARNGTNADSWFRTTLATWHSTTTYSNYISTWTDLADPFLPSITADYNTDYNYYTRSYINTDNSEEYTQYAMYIRYGGTSGFLLGDTGRDSEPQNQLDHDYWYSEAEWENNVSTNVYANLAGDELVELKMIARSLYHGTTSVWTDPWAEVRTPPEEANIPTVHEWGISANDSVGIYWSGTNNADRYAVYYSTYKMVPHNVYNYANLVFISTHTGELPTTSDLYRHDINGDAPSVSPDPSAFVFTSSYSYISVQWTGVTEDLGSSATVYYTLRAGNNFEAYGEYSSPLSNKAFVEPVIDDYWIYADGVHIATNTVSATQTGLLPNTTCIFQVAAVSSDDLAGPLSDGATAYTAAALPIGTTVYALWGETEKHYTKTKINPNGNPDYTEYAIKFTSNSSTNFHWLDSTGTTRETAVWISTKTWYHYNLVGSVTYFYTIIARNLGGQENEGVLVSTRTVFGRPITSPIVCYYTQTSTVTISTDEPTHATDPYFIWGLTFSSFPVVGYSVLWSTSVPSTADSSTLPDSTTDLLTIVNSSPTYQPPTISYVPGERTRYYFTVAAKDAEDQWSDYNTFVFRFVDDTTPPMFLGVSVDDAVEYNGKTYGAPLSATINVTFNDELNSASITDSSIYLVALNNNLGETLNETMSTTRSVTYDTDMTTITINATLSSNYRYKLYITDALTDLGGNSITNPGTHVINAVMLKVVNDTEKNMVKFERTSALATEIDIARGTLLRDSYIIINDSPTIAPRNVDIDVITAANNKLVNKVPVWYAEIDMYDTNHNLQTDEFTTDVTLSMSYQDADENGICDNLKVRYKTLSIWYLDEDRRIWMKLPSAIDRVTKKVQTTLKHFSVYALIGTLNLSVADVMVAPIPWVPEDTKTSTGNLTDGISFINLPAQGDIYVYTITGEEVWHRVLEGNAEERWLGVNANDEEVASGVYLWLVKSPEDKKTGKLIVVR